MKKIPTPEATGFDPGKSQQIPDVTIDHDLVQPDPSTRPQRNAISPLDVDSMPRAEDDSTVFENSPEFHDRPDAPCKPSR
jgi:hypothetical protein